MDGDRKYKQNGYQQSDRDRHSDHGRSDHGRTDSPRPPKQPIDITGPRLPRLVQATAASRCHACATPLLPGIDFRGTCPKCKADLHCCKQCSHFESSTRFQCLKPVPERIAVKDKANECELFSPRVTVARDTVANGPSSHSSTSNGNGDSNGNPRNPTDARAMFDNLFKK